MTDDERIEMAKDICEFMPDWEFSDYSVSSVVSFDGKEIVNTGIKTFTLGSLWTDHNLIHEVLQEIEERGLFQKYIEKLSLMITCDYGKRQFEHDKQIFIEDVALIAGAETKFRAIGDTIKEYG